MPDKNINTIFVDCFNTIIFRTTKRNCIFKNWAQELSEKININAKTIYKTYKKTNFGLCFKKLFTTFTLQEEFDVVLTKMYYKLAKKHNWLELSSFVKLAKEIYIKKELNSFKVNENLISFLQTEKNAGKKIYLVSDFYCKSDIFKFWFNNLNILNLFDNVFSSADFNKEKATTKVYKHLLKTLHLNPKQVIMYGDNVWSDVMMAKACGLNAKRINAKQRRQYE